MVSQYSTEQLTEKMKEIAANNPQLWSKIVAWVEAQPVKYGWDVWTKALQTFGVI